MKYVIAACFCRNTRVRCLQYVSLTSSANSASVYSSRCFSDINILQERVATRLRCGGVFSYRFAANFL